MKEYQQKRSKSGRMSTVTGVAATIAVHVIALSLISFSGLSYIYPPPEEQNFIIDFSVEPLEPVEPKIGRQPVAENVDLEKPVELVQKSESPVKADIPNETPAQEPDSFGDVEVPTPPVEPEQPKVDPRASFPGMGKKESQAGTPHVASDSSAVFKAGQSDGNSNRNSTEGKANAHLKGRRVFGELIKPEYGTQKSGTVVVAIFVDNYGNVEKAYVIPETEDGKTKTTVDDADLWNKARNAAMKTRFDQVKHITTDTPRLQEGTIIYYFKLN